MSNSLEKQGIVDFHSHILPRADHGSSSTEMSLAQLLLAKSYGIDRIVATPHFYPARHNIEDFVERRNSSWNHLKLSLNESHPDIRIGAEVLVCNGIENLPGLDKLFIHGTNTLLLELPFTDFQEEYAESAEKLIFSGVEVVLAHAERYPCENIKKMLNVGCKIQLNADAFRPLFISSHIKKWLSNNSVVALGSDIHRDDKNAYKAFIRAKKRMSDALQYVKAESDRIWGKSQFM